MTEGGTATFTVSLDIAVLGGFSVAPSTTGAGTATVGQDYLAVTDRLAFDGNIGETRTFTVTTTDDAVAEATETLTVSLTDLVSTLPVTLPADAATVTINDNDAAALTLTLASPTVTEGGTATFTVSVDKAVQGGFMVDVRNRRRHRQSW